MSPTNEQTSDWQAQMGAAPDDDEYNKAFEGDLSQLKGEIAAVKTEEAEAKDEPNPLVADSLPTVDGDAALPGELREHAIEGDGTGTALPPIEENAGEQTVEGDGTEKEPIAEASDEAVPEDGGINDPTPANPDPDPEPATPEDDDLEEPIKGEDESDDEYAARRRSWSAKKAARTRAAKAAEEAAAAE